MLPATMWVRSADGDQPRHQRNHVQLRAFSAGSNHTIAAIRKPEAMARKTMSRQPKASRSPADRWRFVMDCQPAGRVKLQKQRREQRAGKVGDKHDPPQSHHAADVDPK